MGRRPQRLRRIERARRRLPYALAQQALEESIVEGLERLELAKLLGSVRGSASPTAAILFWLVAQQHQQGQQEQSKLLPTNDEGPDEASDEAAAPVGSKASPGAGLKAEWGRLLFAEKRRARWALREDEALRRGLAELEEAKEKTPNQGALSLEQTRTLPSLMESAANDVVLAEDDDHHDDGKDESSDDDGDDGSGDDSGDSEGEHDNKTADEDEGEKERRLNDSKKDKTKPAQKEAKNKATTRKRAVSVGLWTKQWPAPKMKLLPNWPHLASTVALVLHEGDVKARETLKESGEYGDEQTTFVGTLALNQSDGGGGSLGYLCLSFRHREVDSKFGGITLSSILSSTDGDGDDSDSGGKENKKASKEGDNKKNKNGKKAGKKKKKKHGKKSSARKSMSDQIAAAVRLKEEEVNVDVAVSYSEPLRPVEECLLKFLGRDGLGRLSFTCPQTSACGVGPWAGAAHRESRAKTSILGLARAFLATRKLSTLRKRLHASRVLQRNCRGFLHRCRFLGWMVSERAAYHECATSVLGPLKHGPFHAFLGRSLGPSFMGPQQLQRQQQDDSDFNDENASGGSCVAGGGQRTALLADSGGGGGSGGGGQSRWGVQATTQLSSTPVSSFGGVSSACVDVVFVLLKALQQGVPKLLSLGLAAPLMEALRQDTVALEGAKRRRKLLLRENKEEAEAASGAFSAVKDDGATDVSSSSLGLSASPAQPPSSSRAVTRTVGDTLPCLAGSDPSDPFGGHPHSSWATPADTGDWTTQAGKGRLVQDLNKRKQTRVSKAEENQGMGSPSRGQPLFTSRDRASYSSALRPSTEHGLKVPTVCSGDGGACPFTGGARAAALANFAMRGEGRVGGGGGGKDQTQQVMQAVAAGVSNARRLSLLKVLGAVLAHPTGRKDLLAKSAAPTLVRCWQSALLVGDYESCLQCCRIVLALVKSEPLLCTYWMASSPSPPSATNKKEEDAAPCVALLVTALPVAMLSITAPPAAADDDVHKGTFSPGSLSVTDQAACLGLDLLVTLLVHSNSNDHKATKKPGGGAAAVSGSDSWLSLKELAALDRGEKILAGNADAGVGTAASPDASAASAAATAAAVVAAATSKEVASTKALLRAWLVERTQVVALLLGTLRELAARRQTLDHPMRYASRFSMTTSSSSAFFTSSELDQDDVATFPRLTTTRRRMLLCDYEAARNATQARDLRLLRERRAEPQVLESAAVILWNLAGIPTSSSSSSTDGGGGEEEGGGTVGRKERRLHALIHEVGAVGTVVALLRCSLWPLASRLGALLLVCLAETRAQKYDYVAAGCLPLLHQLAVLGCGVEVGPAAKRAIEALSETLKEPPAGGSFASGSHGGGVHGDFPHEVALSALDMAVFGAGWSSGSAALPLSSENIYRAKPKGVF